PRAILSLPPVWQARERNRAGLGSGPVWGDGTPGGAGSQSGGTRAALWCGRASAEIADGAEGTHRNQPHPGCHDARRLAARGSGGGHTLPATVRRHAKAPVVNTDDTGWRVGGRPAHLMVFVSAESTVYQIRGRHRNQEVRE